MSVNWGDLQKVAEDGGFTVLPPGEYDVYVTGASGGKTSTAKDRIRVTFKVENGPHAGQPVVNDFVITPDNANAMSIFFRHMTILGLGAEYFAASPRATIEKVAADMAAKRARCRLRLSTRVWQGQDRNNVDAILPPEPGTAASAPTGAGSAVPLPAAGVAAGVPQTESLPVPSTPKLPDDLPF